jgi:hypothetical protein
VVRDVVVALGVVAAVALSIYAVTHALSARQEHRFEEAYELKKALVAGRLSGVAVHVEPRPMPISVTIDGYRQRVRASRVLVLLGGASPAFEENSSEAWRVWGNGTHFGAASYIKVEDSGYTVKVYYYNATPYAGASLCTYPSGSALARFYARTGGTVEWYSFAGPREVVIQEVRVEPCRQ